MNPERHAEYVRVSRADLRTLLDWYDEPEHDTWGDDVPQVVRRLRRQVEKLQTNLEYDAARAHIDGRESDES